MAALPSGSRTKKLRAQAARGPEGACCSGSLLALPPANARRSGVLGGAKTQPVSFHAPAALVEAAKRETGISSTSELGMLGLAVLAGPDPVAVFFRRTEGRLGLDHNLEF
jgi:hypothetical protein